MKIFFANIFTLRLSGKKLPLYIFLAAFVLMNASCKVYSLSAGRIPPEIKTVTVYSFTNISNNGSAILSQKATNALKNYFIQRTSLKFADYNGDIEFKGVITGYQIQGQAPTAAVTTALNRLTITIKVDYTNNTDQKQSWSSTFSRYEDYNSNLSLIQVEDQLQNDIFQQLVDDVYNKALVNW